MAPREKGGGSLVFSLGGTTMLYRTVIRLLFRSRLQRLLPIAVVGVVGCNRNNLTCAQVILAASPAVVVTSVTSKRTGAAVDTFYVSNFVISAQTVPASGVVSSVPGTNATVVNGTLQCARSCGFGGVEGTYTFTVSAAGLPDAAVTVNAKYARGIGQGCSHELKDGTTVAVSL